MKRPAAPCTVNFNSMGPCLSLPSSEQPTTITKGYALRSSQLSSLASKASAMLKKTASTTGLPNKRQRVPPQRDVMADLPDDLVMIILQDLEDATDLAVVAGVSKRFRELSKTESLWLDVYADKWGIPTDLTQRAMTIAGSWKALYGSKLLAERASSPWCAPCEEETAAMVHNMCDVIYRSTVDGKPELADGLEVVFLLDGSGSVTDEDFSTMSNFLGRAGATILSRVADASLGIVQFSNDARVERDLTEGPTNPASWAASVSSLQRINGGTNIAAPIRKAGKMFARDASATATAAASPNSAPPPPPPQLPSSSSPTLETVQVPPPPPPPPVSKRCVARVVALLTDGRVDSYQAREAVTCSARLMDETPNCEVYAFGVGRGVDSEELGRITCAAKGPGHDGGAGVIDRYMPLRVLHDNDDDW